MSLSLTDEACVGDRKSGLCEDDGKGEGDMLDKWSKCLTSSCPHIFISGIMCSSFEGWRACDIVGSLNKSEVRSVLLDFDLEKSCFRSWDSIENMISNSSDEVKDVLYRSALAKKKVEEQHRAATLKRKREYKELLRNTRRRMGEY